MANEIVLTGDRPTGQLHLGHYVGSLLNRVELQNKYKQYVMIADIQALTDNYEDPKKVHDNVIEVAIDYLSVGIDPKKTTIFIQSMIPQIADLTVFYLNLVTVNRLKRNPTVKNEIQQKGFGESIPAGFFVYPVSQAADITVVNGTLVPVGEDQLPMIEQTNEIVRSFNRIYKTEVLKECKALISKHSRLSGTDGRAKMSKSLNNVIFLSDSEDLLQKKIMSMYTDPNHIKVEDPGQIENNTVFEYLDAFDTDKTKVEELKNHYQQGGLGDVKVKKYLFEVLNNILMPIRQRRKELEQDKEYILSVLKAGTQETLEVAEKTLQDVKSAMQLVYF
ncbi:tryptophan--tRNA ligase [candidate division TM6 bacterium RIFCSPHIGHO2_12_FULL_32_22]|nr:MAG: tryptophan--tRNA ligase [candidate division TM6 bacterium RIFCSPHIGHO2_12_FULL_32_22]